MYPAPESKMNEFRIKILNQRLSGSKLESFTPVKNLKKCRITPDEFHWHGRKVYVGVDLAQTGDNTAVSMLTEEDGVIYCKSWCFIPTDRVQEKSFKEKIDYIRYIAKGYCFDTGDLIIDYSFIENFIMNLENKYGVEIVQIGYDRYNAISTANKLENAGYMTIEIKQHSSTLGAPIKLLEESILQQKFKYEENELLEINFSNIKVDYDTNMNKYFHKKKSNGKIDMCMSILNALYLLQNEILYKEENFGAYII